MDIQKTGVKIIFTFLFLSLMSLVVAAPPFLQTSDLADTSVIIEAPVLEYIKANEAFDFHIHIHNSTNGILLDNTTTSCYLHLYSSGGNGHHLIEDEMGFDSNNFDFFYEVSAGNLTEGSYAILFYCEVPGERGGFLEYSFVANNGGDSNVFILVTDIFMICLIIFFFTMVTKKFGDADFEALDKRIVEKHDSNWMKTFGRSFGYGLMKNAFLWYYLGGWFLVFFLRDIMYRFGSTELYGYLLLTFDLYSFGFILVIGFFIGMIYQHFERIRDIIDDISRGVN